jgi:biotin carboxyl carrier protein
MSERTGVTAVTQAPAVPAAADPIALPEPGPAAAGPTGPGEPPAAPPERRRGATLRRWWARFLVVALIVAAVLLGQRVIDSQAARDAALDLGTVRLTSQAIPVESAAAGMVTSVSIVPGQHVTAGQQLGELLSTATDAEGEVVQRRHPVTAPRDGVVVDDPVTVGSTLQPGVAFAELYDPGALRLVAEVPAAQLVQITPGMRAELGTDGLDREIRAVVLRAVPAVPEADERVPRTTRFELWLAPEDPAQVAGLIPGLQLTGSVDTRTAPEGSKESVYVG